MIIKIILLAIVLIGVAVAGIAIKMFFQKGGQFSKSCASVIDESGKPIGCVCSSEIVETSCPNYEEHHGNNIS